MTFRLLRTALDLTVDNTLLVAAAARRGVLVPQPPIRVARMAAGLLTRGSVGGAIHALAVRYGDRAAVVDEAGTLSYRELDERSDAIANAWLARGLEPGQGVAILARNHRGFLEAVCAAGKCGARIVLLNTDFSGPQLREVANGEGTDLLVHDEEYGPLLEGVSPLHGRWIAWSDGVPGPDSLEHLATQGATPPPGRPRHQARLTILTSGTTGAPKGAMRSVPKNFAPVGGLFARVPFHQGHTMVLCAPMFHSLGLMSTLVALGLGNTLVLRRRFDPEWAWRAVVDRRAESLVVVPVMLQRILEAADPGSHPAGLKAVLSGGSQLGSELARRTLQRLGPVLYNLYGSTEVAYATIATPADLAVAPATVGRVVRGTTVRIVDADGHDVPTGETGRVFVGNALQFEGYTGGGGKEVLDGLMASGDVGHLDEQGRLFIDGRDDEMIVSGGENVFPREVEELYEQHPAVLEAAAVGVPDETFGQRLRAFLVLRPGSSFDEESAKAFVRDHLARYKVPREVVYLDRLPRNPTGKVLKRELVD